MAEHPSEGLARLSPQDRALIELSVQKGLTDDEIAQVLQVDAREVRRMREAALKRLEEAESSVLSPQPSEEEPSPRGERPRRQGLLVGVLLAVVAGAAVAIALAGGGDDDEPERAATTPQTETTPATQTETAPATETEPEPEPAPQPKPKPRPAPARTMDVLNDTHGRGTAQLVTDGRTSVRLRVRDFLEPQGGGYAVWLFNSVEDARRLFATRGTDWTRTIPLPDDYDRYRYIEIARAVPDLNSDHSGLSLLRVAIADLSRKG